MILSSLGVIAGYGVLACPYTAFDVNFQVGTYSTTSSVKPFNGLYNYSINGNIYSSSIMPSVATQLTGLQVWFQSFTTPYTVNNQELWIGEVSDSTFGASPQVDFSDLTFVNPLVKVKNAFTCSITSNELWYTFTFDTPYCYSGAGNILLVWKNYDGSWASGRGTSGVANIVSKSMTKASDPSFPTGTGTRDNFPLLVKFNAKVNTTNTNLVFDYDTYNVSSYPGSGATLFDISGNGNNMTLLQEVLPAGTPSNSNIGWHSTGIKRLVFNDSSDGSNGSNSQGRVPISTTNDTLGYTFGGWIKATTGGSAAFNKGADGIYGGWAMSLAVSGTGYFVQIINASSQNVSLSGTTALTTNQWYYVVCQYVHNSQLRLWINGVQTDVLNQGATVISLRSSPGWTIASLATNTQYRAIVSTYQMYNRVLSSAELLANFNEKKSRYGY